RAKRSPVGLVYVSTEQPVASRRNIEHPKSNIQRGTGLERAEWSTGGKGGEGGLIFISFRYSVFISVFTCIGGQNVSGAGQGRIFRKKFARPAAGRRLIGEEAAATLGRAEAAVAAAASGGDKNVLLDVGGKGAEHHAGSAVGVDGFGEALV